MSEDVVSGCFIWDAEKAEQNLELHGIPLRDSMTAFLDPDRLIVLDPQHSHRELRFYCVGWTKHGVTTVRFTFRDDKIRLFGAGTWRKWRKLYEAKKNVR